MGELQTTFSTEVLIKLDLPIQKNEDSPSYQIPELLKVDQSSRKKRDKTTKYLEENTEENFPDLGLGDCFLNMIIKMPATKAQNS